MTITQALFKLLEHFKYFVITIAETNFSIFVGARDLRYSCRHDQIICEDLTIHGVKTFTVQEETDESGEKSDDIIITFADNTTIKLSCS